MTTVVKLDSSSQESYTNIQNSAEKIHEMVADDEKVLVVVEAPKETVDRLDRILYCLSSPLKDELEFILDEEGENLEPEMIFERQLTELGENADELVENHLRRYSGKLRLLVEMEENPERYTNSNGLGGDAQLVIYSLLRSYPSRLQSIVFLDTLEKLGISSKLLDFEDHEFPVQVGGEALCAYPALPASREAAQKMDWRETDVYIIPGGVGSEDGLVKNMGTGSGEISAFVCLYALQADVCYICTDSPGVRIGPFEDSDILDSIDIEEARFAGLLNAKLNTPKSVNPLSYYYDEIEEEPTVEITNIEDMGISGTRIIRDSGSTDPVRFIGSRHITTAHLQGQGYASLQREMDKHGVDSFTYGSGWGNVRIGIVDGELRANDIIGKFRKTGQLDLVEYDTDACILGATGRGMAERSGISDRIYGALADSSIIVVDGCDLSKYFTGVIINHRDQDLATRLVYEEFFG